jgi:putative transcriptional regulator
MAISNNLKDIRVERNLIQEDLAEATGSCSRTISRIERGERNPSLEMAIRLAHYLNMSVEEIFKLDDATFRQQKIKE